jgi:hypothetical protein
MADKLQQYADNNDLTSFTKEWYQVNNVALKNGAPADGKDYGPHILNSFNMYKGNKGGGGGGSPATSAPGTAGMYKIQDLGQKVTSYNQGDVIQPSVIAESIKDVMAGFFSKEGGLIKGLGNVGSMALKGVMEGATDILTKEVTLRNELNSQIGIAGELSRDYRNEIFEALPGVVSMGYGFEDLKKTVISTMEETGRFALMNSDTMKQMATTSRAFVGDLEDMGRIFRNFEMVGVGAQDALNTIDKVGKSSLTLGLQSRKVVDETQKNLGKINEYGFAKGIEGLGRMVQKSIEFRMNMESVTQIADKVFDPEGAVDLAANLQAIGGAIGDFNDPLKLMYMATNNVEGLQDALIGVAGSLATYNEEQGRFEITGVNLRKAKAMAKELGISYSELANGAIAAAERSSAASAMLSSGLNLSDENKEFLTNISRMEGGSMVIDVPESLAKKLGLTETRVALEDLSQGTADAILGNQKYFEKLSPEEIAKEQYTETQKLALTVSEISTMLKVQFAKTVRTPLSQVDNYIKELNDSLTNKEGGFTAEMDRIKSETNKMAEEYVKKDLGIKTNAGTSQQPINGNLNINHNFSDASRDKLRRDFELDDVFGDNLKRNFLEYTSQPKQ